MKLYLAYVIINPMAQVRRCIIILFLSVFFFEDKNDSLFVR